MMKLNNIYKELLNEDFKSQRVNFIKQGYDSNIVDDYIGKFKHIRDAKYRSIGDNISNFDIEPKDRLDIDRYKNFRDLEVFVDYVGGKHAVKTNLKSNDIVIDGKPIYNQDGIEVYYADSPRACIKYKGSVPYSWCVARSDSSNMFYTYRFKPYEPAFYFIKDVAATKKELGYKSIFNDSEETITILDKIPDNEEFKPLIDFIKQYPMYDTIGKLRKVVDDAYMNVRNIREWDYYEQLLNLINKLK